MLTSRIPFQVILIGISCTWSLSSIVLHVLMLSSYSQGLAVVFAESPSDIRNGPESTIVPDDWFDVCDDYYNAPLSDQLPMSIEWMDRGRIGTLDGDGRRFM